MFSVSTNEYIIIVSIAFVLTAICSIFYNEALDISVSMYPSKYRFIIKAGSVLFCYAINFWLPIAMMTIILFIPSVYLAKWYTDYLKQEAAVRRADRNWNTRRFNN